MQHLCLLLSDDSMYDGAMSAFVFGYGSFLCVGFIVVPYAVSLALEATFMLAEHPITPSVIWRLVVSLFDQRSDHFP